MNEIFTKMESKNRIKQTKFRQKYEIKLNRLYKKVYDKNI